MKKSRLIGAVCAGVFSLSTTISYAALTPKLGGQAVYDGDRDITWIANANLALTNQFGLTLSLIEEDRTDNTVSSTGKMTWDNAQAWIAGMNAANYLGFDDWHLPTTLQPDASCDGQSDPGGGFPLQGFGSGCTGSQMGHLFNVEGVTSVAPGLFSNVQPSRYYSSTEFAPDTPPECPLDTCLVWSLGFNSGSQNTVPKGESTAQIIYFAWAVRSGDVGDGLPPPVIDDSATVADDADIGDGSTVGAGAVIERGVTIGDGSSIGPNVTINKDVTLGDNATIGEGSTIHKNVMAGGDLTVGTNVVIHKDVMIGARVTIGDNSQIHMATVIGNDVHIGMIGGGVGVFVGNRVTIPSSRVIGDGDVIPNDTTVP